MRRLPIHWMMQAGFALLLAFAAAPGCGRKPAPPAAPPERKEPAAPVGPELPVNDPDKRAKHMTWEYEIGKSTPGNRIEVIRSIADGVEDEEDAYLFLNIILHRVPEYEWRSIDLWELVSRWRNRGPTYEAFKTLFQDRFKGVEDLSPFKTGSHFSLYLARRGFDQDGRPLSAWTKGEVWKLVRISDETFPRIDVRVIR